MQSPGSRDSDSRSRGEPRNLFQPRKLCSIILACGFYGRMDKRRSHGFLRPPWDAWKRAFPYLVFILQSQDGLQGLWMRICILYDGCYLKISKVRKAFHLVLGSWTMPITMTSLQPLP
jgi:hypothetical protein